MNRGLRIGSGSRLGGLGAFGIKGGGSVVQTTVVLQPAEAAAFDAKIDVENPDTNFGTENGIVIGDVSAGAGRLRGLWKFDLSSIPSSATVVSATLSLYESSCGDNPAIGNHPINLHRLLKNWVETQVTWNIYSTGNSWGTAGVGMDDIDSVATPSSSLVFDNTAAQDFVNWTGLGPDVQAFLNGSVNNYGWLLISPNAENRASGTTYQVFANSGDVQAARRPKLTVIYT